jgi:hypothetical protein
MLRGIGYDKLINGLNNQVGAYAARTADVAPASGEPEWRRETQDYC